jgi:peroxiredoxin
MNASTKSDEAQGPGDAAADLLLTDDQGQSVRLSDLWQKQPLVLLFVRHFG